MALLRAMHVMKCVHCNSEARFIVLPSACTPSDAPILFRDGTVNGKAVECPVQENNHCSPPEVASLDLDLTNDGITFGEVQILAAITGLKFDTICQKLIRDATSGCIFCLIGLGKIISACTEPLKQEDFVIEPAYLQDEVLGRAKTLHIDAHGRVFSNRRKRKFLKRPPEPRKNPGIRKGTSKKPSKRVLFCKKRFCKSCGHHYLETDIEQHQQACAQRFYNCIYCRKHGFHERDLRRHLWTCKKVENYKAIGLNNPGKLAAHVQEIISAQDQKRAKRQAKLAPGNSSSD